MEEPCLWPVGAFEEVFRAHYRNLVRLMTRICGDGSQAEEIAADALWKLWRHPELMAPGNSIGGWLYRTGSRMAMDRVRSRRRQARTVEALGREPQRAAEHPLGVLERRERVLTVRRALRRLPRRQARMLWLRHEGAAYREVASALGVQASSVGTLLGRAEAELSKQFDFQSI